jgi:predicted anti-sigma-YlaC factor YlaD
MLAKTRVRSICPSVRSFASSSQSLSFLLASVAQSHVVSPADLQKEMVAGTQARQHNVKTARQFLSSQRAERQTNSHGQAIRR